MDVFSSADILSSNLIIFFGRGCIVCWIIVLFARVNSDDFFDRGIRSESLVFFSFFGEINTKIFGMISRMFLRHSHVNGFFDISVNGFSGVLGGSTDFLIFVF